MIRKNQSILVCGAGGFIGSHIVNHIKTTRPGVFVRGIDIKYPEFNNTTADEFVIGDLRDKYICEEVLVLKSKPFDEVYQLAADMGGAGYIFNGEHDANVMRNSAQINLNFVNLHTYYRKIFFSSSACIYPEYNQLDPNNPNCHEDSAYPANPDSEYGW
jgi:nucleoside-diphosphate-sugar epimerase